MIVEVDHPRFGSGLDVQELGDPIGVGLGSYIAGDLGEEGEEEEEEKG